MLAFLFYLVCWSLVIFLAFGMFGKWAWLMIGVSVTLTAFKALGPWWDAWVELQREKGLERIKKEEELKKQREELSKDEKVISLDDRR